MNLERRASRKKLRERISLGWKRLKNAGRKFAVAVPLAASLAAGCAEKGKTESEIHDAGSNDTIHEIDAPFVCSNIDSLLAGNYDSHCRFNETTIMINREEVDGKIASLSELEAPPEDGNLLTEQYMDFINETHAISTEPLPSCVYAVLLPPECHYNALASAINGEFWGKINAFAPIVFLNGSNSVNVLDIFHEVGHLQVGSFFEVISQLNSYEQGLMGFVLFLNQGSGSPADSIKWVSSLTRWLTRGFEPRLYKIITQPPQFDFRDYFSLDYSVYYKHRYQASAAFIFFKLLDNNGDFRGLRDYVSSLLDNGCDRLMGEVLGDFQSFIDQFSTSDYPGGFPIADVSLSIRMLFFQELLRRFDYHTAMQYFYVQSRSIPSGDNLEAVGNPLRLVRSGLVNGLDDMSCVTTKDYFTEPQNYSKISPCAGEPVCSGMIGVDVYDSSDYSYCCVSADAGSSVTFRKWVVHALVDKYYNSAGSPVMAQGAEWDAVYFVNVTEKEEISLGEPCR